MKGREQRGLNGCITTRAVRYGREEGNFNEALEVGLISKCSTFAPKSNAALERNNYQYIRFEMGSGLEGGEVAW